jgi:hypothetical protein
LSDLQEFGGYVLGLVAGLWVGYYFGEIHRHLKEVDRGEQGEDRPGKED